MAKTNSISKVIRKEFPEVYWVAGIGWCGPQWHAAVAREVELLNAVLRAA